MGRPQELVHRLNGFDAPAAVAENAGVVREGLRIAGDIGGPGQFRSGERFGKRGGSGARRVEYGSIVAIKLGGGERAPEEIANFRRDRLQLLSFARSGQKRRNGGGV